MKYNMVIVTDEIIEIPKSQWYHFIDALTRMDELLEANLKVSAAILEAVKVLAVPPGFAPNYLSEEFEVVAGTPKKIRVEDELGRVAKVGYLKSDDGTVYMQVGDAEGKSASASKIKVKVGEVFTFEKDDEWSIGEVLVTTDSTSSLTCRIFLK